jgi:hypothetical protein
VNDSDRTIRARDKLTGELLRGWLLGGSLINLTKSYSLVTAELGHIPS